MLQINVIRENTELVLEGLKKRNMRDAESLINQALAVDKVRREKQQQYDAVVGESNRISKEVGILMKAGKKQEADEMIAKMATSKKSAAEIGQEMAAAEEELQRILYLIPNVPSKDEIGRAHV